MIEDTLSAERARRFYDWLGKRHDWAEFYESRAKRRALQQLALSPGLDVLNVGVGTGKEHAAITAQVGPQGRAFAVDLSPVMLRLARERTAAPVVQADGRLLPFASARFDRVFAAYVLDLIPASDLTGVLAAFRRVLKPGGRLVVASLTEGVNPPSRAFVALWKAAYAVSPVVCGGCRPIQLAALAGQAGFDAIQREVVVQMGVPSEVLVATRRVTGG